MKKPKTQIQVGGALVDLGQSVPAEKQQDWKNRLVLVSSLPNRFVGLIEEGDAAKQGRPFTLYGALMYVAELTFQPVLEMQDTPEGPRPIPGPDGQPRIMGIRGSTRLHTLIPYDFLGAPDIEITSLQYMLRISAQDEEFQNFVYKEYQSYFDPPRVLPPSPIVRR